MILLNVKTKNELKFIAFIGMRKAEKWHIVHCKVWSWNELERLGKWWIVVNENLRCITFFVMLKIDQFSFWPFVSVGRSSFYKMNRNNEQTEINEWMFKRNATASCEFFPNILNFISWKILFMQYRFHCWSGKKRVANNKRCIPRESSKLEWCVFRLDFICRISVVPVPEIDHNICVEMCVFECQFTFCIAFLLSLTQPPYTFLHFVHCTHYTHKPSTFFYTHFSLYRSFCSDQLKWKRIDEKMSIFFSFRTERMHQPICIWIWFFLYFSVCKTRNFFWFFFFFFCFSFRSVSFFWQMARSFICCFCWIFFMDRFFRTFPFHIRHAIIKRKTMFWTDELMLNIEKWSMHSNWCKGEVKMYHWSFMCSRIRMSKTCYTCHSLRFIYNS